MASFINGRPTQALQRASSLGLRMSENATIEETDPPWIHSVSKQIERLRELKPNWDGEGAPTINLDSCLRCLMFLLDHAAPETAAPTIVPTSEGGLQAEWHIAGIDLEIQFNPQLPVTFYFVDESGLELEGDASSASHRIAIILRQMPAAHERIASI